MYKKKGMILYALFVIERETDLGIGQAGWFE